MEDRFIETFKEIRSDLDVLDGKRESILTKKRQIIRNCSEIIKNIHRSELEGLDEKIDKTKDMIEEQESDAKYIATHIGKNYINDVKQEFTEAVLLYSIVTEKSIPGYQQLGVNAYEYLMGLADVVGELKRLILNKIRYDDFDNAEYFYDVMEEIQQLMFSLDYPSGLLPGFRHKVDISRNIIRKTIEIITTTKSNYNLNQNINGLLENKKE